MDRYLEARLNYEIIIQATVRPWSTGYTTDAMYIQRNDAWDEVASARMALGDQWIELEQEFTLLWSVLDPK